MSLNRYICTGHLTRDAELRRTQSGMAIVSFGIAVNDRRKNSQTGDWEDFANFFDVSCFGDRYEKLSKYLVKGKKIALEGKLRWSQWERDGHKRSKVEIIADDIELLGSKENNGQQKQTKAEYVEATVYDDCPF